MSSGIRAVASVKNRSSEQLHKYLRCCNITNGCCLIIALPCTIPLIILMVDVEEFVSFSTWVCLTYGAFFGVLFIAYEFRSRVSGTKQDGSPKKWEDWINEQYGFMSSYLARTCFLICLGFFMGGAGPLGWAVSTWCFLHGFFLIYVYCGNQNIKSEVKGGTFNASGPQNDAFDKAAGGVEWAAANPDKVRAGATQASAAAQWGATHQQEVQQAARFAQQHPDAARAVASAASGGGTTAI
jgi:hypothetical protein